MISLLFAVCTAFIVALLLVPLIIRIATSKQIFDTPGGRKIHTRYTPSYGGIAIFAGFAIAMILWPPVAKQKTALVFISVLLIPFVLGFFDDRYHLRPRVKIAIQTVAASLLFFALDVRISSLYGLFSVDAPLSLFLSYAFTLVTVIVITNSYNLIDGIDGLAAVVALLALAFFGVWFFLTGNVVYAFLSCSLIGAIVAFLFYNWEPSKIFMGDTGSLLIGTVLALLSIEFLNKNHRLALEAPFRFESSVGTALCLIIVPIFDTVRVIIIRLSRGISPLAADKRHVHHVLVRIGHSHRFAVAVICVAHIAFIAVAIALRSYSDKILIPTAAAMCGLAALLLALLIRRNKIIDRSSSS